MAAAVAALWLLLCGGANPQLSAATATLQNGFRLEGAMVEVGSVGIDPFATRTAGEIQNPLILMADDGLRRTFVPLKNVASRANTDQREVKIEVEFQRVPEAGRRVASVGSIVRIDPFNEFGRRVLVMNGPQGNLEIVQGIKEVTPLYTRVEGLTPYRWDMRVATTSIDREILSKILIRGIDEKDADQRLQIYKLYVAADRFDDARVELEQIVRDFPKLSAMQREFQTLNQLRTDRLLNELKARQRAGQHSRVFQLLSKFPTENVATESLLQVRDMVNGYQKQIGQRDRSLQLLNAEQKGLARPEVRDALADVVKTINEQLNVHTLPRMATQLRLADDPGLDGEQKLSLAVSGWLLGADHATENIGVTTSLARAEPLVRSYLRSKHSHEREAVLKKLSEMEGATPANIARLLDLMTPPLDLSDATPLQPGLFEVTAPGPAGEPDIQYLVQLPPEYSSHRKYPCVLTLCGAGTTPELQIDWWAGSMRGEQSERHGHAARNGYIVIAPRWTEPHQREYGYSFREHSIVLSALRNALQRLSIDSDRVFLSGHSMGGDAAWDIALAHPDLWAGVIPIVAGADKYVTRLFENAKLVSFYFVGGDMDAQRPEENSREIDRYMLRQYDVTLVEYRGRGHENFHDEILRIYDWMNLHKRNFFPSEFTMHSMRAWDNFFWCVELDGFPERSVVPPLAWPKPNARPATTEVQVLPNNNVLVNSAARTARLFLTPDMVRFDKPSVIVLNKRRVQRGEPDLKILLEDARTRGDRQHPFWAICQE